jgi:hypothetical protein
VITARAGVAYMRCLSSPKLDQLEEDERLAAKFSATAKHAAPASAAESSAKNTKGGGTMHRFGPPEENGDRRARFNASDGRYALAKEWTPPSGPVPFNPEGSTRVTLATLPGVKQHRCLLFNVGDALVVRNYDAASTSEPIRILCFPGTFVTCHAHRPCPASSPDARDLLLGLANGEVHCVSLRGLIREGGRGPSRTLPSGSLKFNSDGGGGCGGSAAAKSAHLANAPRCNDVAWNPGSAGGFISVHADGNVYAYLDPALDAGADPRFPPVKGDVSSVSVTPGRTEGSNPFARWHLSGAPLTAAAFSPPERAGGGGGGGGQRCAVVGLDGLCRVLDVRDWERPSLVDGFKGYYGGLNHVCWAHRGKYILAGGEADMIEVWNVRERAVVAWAEGLNSYALRCAADEIASAALTRGVGVGGGRSDDDDDADAGDDGDATIGDMDLGDGASEGARGASAGGGGGAGGGDLLHEIEPVETLRFGAVGADCALCLWDLPVDGDDDGGDDDDDRAGVPFSGDEMELSQRPAAPYAFGGDAKPPLPVPLPRLPPSSGDDKPPSRPPSRSPSRAGAPLRPDSPSSVMSHDVAAGAADGAGAGAGAADANESDDDFVVATLAAADDDDPRLPSIFAYVGVGQVIAPSACRGDVHNRLSPVVSRKLHDEPTTEVLFNADGVVTACAGGIVKLWARPGGMDQE